MKANHKLLFAFFDEYRDRYCTFLDATAARGEVLGHMAQFKTEKWLQAELLFFLVSNREKSVLPEYHHLGGRYRWDLRIGDERLVALKDFAGSGQGCSVDRGLVDVDIDEVVSTDFNSALLVVLPLHRESYTSTMSKHLKDRARKSGLVPKDRDIALTFDRGIKVVVLEKNV